MYGPIYGFHSEKKMGKIYIHKNYNFEPFGLLIKMSYVLRRQQRVQYAKSLSSNGFVVNTL